MAENDVQHKILAKALYEIRILLGTGNMEKDPPVRAAARIAYALHNEARAILQGRTFDVEKAIKKLATRDGIFDPALAAKIKKSLKASPKAD
ncbi:MAG: hypothetical protein JWO95_859 [Verrucomicrobiales bacterium]|nr:hypothetical protein [Verrucomicrobiales bacterium]